MYVHSHGAVLTQWNRHGCHICIIDIYIYRNAPLVNQRLPRRASVKMARITFLFQLILGTVTLSSVYGKLGSATLPAIDLNEWWGPGNASSSQSTEITNFTIPYDETLVNDLINRFKNHRPFTPPLEGINHQYGFNSEDLIVWIKYIINEYQFEARLKLVNKLSHFRTMIQGLNIHFVRSTAESKSGVPLVPIVLLHSWPGSFLVYNETIPYLQAYSAARNIPLDIIVPSIPGYTYSDAPVRIGCGVDKMAVIIRNLMNRLGYTKYYVHGEGMGSMIAMNMATFFFDEVLGFHSTYPLFHTPEMIFRLFSGYDHPEEIASTELQDRVYPSLTVLARIIENIGYIHMHSTKPDAFGEWLNDSPPALFAHMLITNGTPTNPGSEITPLKQVDNVMLYWYTSCITTAMRLYAETFNLRYIELRLNEIPSPVPTWVLQTKEELFYLPPWLMRKKFPNTLNETLPSVGSQHYPWSHPEPFAKDLINALVAFNDWHSTNGTSYCHFNMDK